jgi:hypothetical protein
MSVRPIHHCTCEVCRGGANAAIVAHHEQINLLLSRLNEPQRRWFVATLYSEPEHPSERRLSEITGLDEKTIRRGKAEMGADLSTVPVERQRREGGGRPPAEKKTVCSKTG